ncbi:MAG: hypothetical protein LBD80_00865 [Tannerella sp.]|nr:hypothetical protein [Tannerella sp.]
MTAKIKQVFQKQKKFGKYFLSDQPLIKKNCYENGNLTDKNPKIRTQEELSEKSKTNLPDDFTISPVQNSKMSIKAIDIAEFTSPRQWKQRS